MGEVKHGTQGTYCNHHCRCDECREANRLALLSWRRRNGVGPPTGPQPIKHGTVYAYQKRGCRCSLCRAASSARMAAWRAKQRQEAE